MLLKKVRLVDEFENTDKSVDMGSFIFIHYSLSIVMRFCLARKQNHYQIQ
jgi:hypothetical protein